jgi:hypothetical protein
LALSEFNKLGEHFTGFRKKFPEKLNERDYRRLIRHREERYNLLKGWFGETRARQEMAAHTGQPVDINALIPDICAELADEDSGMFIDIDTRWSELIGGDFANMTRPVKVQNRVLYVEVRHVLLLRELSPSADIFLQQINSRREGPPCTELRFVPPGGARR